MKQPARLRCLLPILAVLLLNACSAPRFQEDSPRGAAQPPRLGVDHASMADGYRLPLARWLPSGTPRAVVLALHGFNDYRHAFAGLGPALAARGMAVYAYDQRGFGATATRGRWPGSTRLVDDARSMAKLLKRHHKGLPLYILGESMGGAVAMALLGGDDPPPVAGAVLIAPAVWARKTMPLYQRAALWLGARLLPGLTLTGESLRIRASDNDTMLRRLGADPLVIHRSRIDTLYGLGNLMDRALAAAPQLNVPALILYGMHDQIIPRTPVCRMLATLPAKGQWRFVLYAEGYHMLTRDLHGARVVADIGRWLEDRHAPLPSGSEVTAKVLHDLRGGGCAALWRQAGRRMAAAP